MPATDPRVNLYIEKAAPFAKPVLLKIRKLIFQACPDARETIKWNFPNYEVHGSLLCSMAAFKEHCSFGFWKAPLLKDSAGILRLKNKNAMGHLDRITSLKDLPADKVLLSYLQEAALLNKNNIKVSKPKAPAKKEPTVPKDLADALKRNKKAASFFDAFSPSNRREYIEWINDAKTEETRYKRLTQTMEWLEEGKSRNWKYQKS